MHEKITFSYKAIPFVRIIEIGEFPGPGFLRYTIWKKFSHGLGPVNGDFGKISLSLLELNLIFKAMSSDKYVLQEVVDARTEREFLDLPRKIYKGNRNWVCPLDPSIQAVFDPKKNEMFSDGEAIRWIARDKKGEVVGRIAAFYDREHAFLEEQPTGGCGFFEAINDQELADQLFDAARMWLSSRGMEADCTCSHRGAEIRTR